MINFFMTPIMFPELKECKVRARSGQGVGKEQARCGQGAGKEQGLRLSLESGQNPPARACSKSHFMPCDLTKLLRHLLLLAITS